MSDGKRGLPGESLREERRGLAPERASSGPEPDAWRRFSEARNRAEFLSAWIELEVRLVPGARAGLLALCPPDGGAFTPVASWPGNSDAASGRLADASERALVNGQAVIVRAQSRLDAQPGQLPPAQLAWPVRVHGKLRGVVAIEVAGTPDDELQDALHHVQWGSAWLEVLLKEDSVVASPEREGGGEELRAVLDLVAATVEQEGFRPAATSLVNELATRLACDRASLGVAERERLHVRAMSHVGQIEKRTNLVRAIESAMEEAFDQEGIVQLPPARGGEFRVTLAHEELSRQGGSRAVLSLPFGRGADLTGVLTLERQGDSPFEPAEVELCEALVALAGPVLELARREEVALPRRVAASSRAQLRKLTGPRHALAKGLAVVALLVVLFFVFARADYRVSAPTAIESSVRRAAVAPFEGYVAESHKRAGDLVEAGELLCVLDARELELERHRFVSQRDQYQKQYNQALAQRNAAEIRIVSAQIEQVEAQLALVEDRLSRTQVVSPIAGIVANGDLSQSIGAPTERGQVLFEIAPLEDYRVILEVDERDVAEIEVGQAGVLVLNAFPSEPLDLIVDRITPVSSASEGRNHFRVEARLVADSERLRPGMEGIGKVEVGERRLIWIWTHRAIDWVRLTVWTWMP